MRNGDTKSPFVIQEVIKINNEKKKKGMLSVIKESMSKTGGCCGPGETCGGPEKKNDKAPVEGTKRSDKTNKSKV